MDLSLIISAFFAGLLTFLAPCTLPLAPGYLAFISGVSLAEKDLEQIKKSRRRIFLNGVFFILGFSLVFISLGSLFGVLGRFFIFYRPWIGRIGGIFVILFGLSLLNIFKIPFLKKGVIFQPKIFSKNSFLTSFIFGAAFSSGWTPCVGPILGAILVLATTSATALKGALLLAIFSAGLAVPFILLSLLVSSSFKFIPKISKYLNIFSTIGGFFLIFLGVLLLTDNMAWFVAWTYYLLRFIQYDKIINYL
ncbi:MAG: sulfite exporter TauE/SafE family protein [Parcubacteria group bacterium]|nr:sulfite exporter TauE/SafE family protein [Parcubacteria group bacterium]